MIIEYDGVCWAWHIQMEEKWNVYKMFFFLIQCPHMSLTDFVVFPPGDGRSVTDFSGWDVHEARLRCPDDVSGDIGGCSARRALKPNFN